MMLTREQAAEVWCPMVRVDCWQSDKQCCIADRCAMWRWLQGGQKNSAGDRHPTTRGYCGLAGVPVIGGAA